MAAAYKTDVDSIAQQYLKGPVDGLGVYRSGNIPPNTNPGPVAPYNTNPGAAYPSRSMGGNTDGEQVKALMLNLVQVYINLGYGTYGLHNTDLVTGATWITGGGTALFSLGGNNGARGVVQGYPAPTKKNLTKADVQAMYSAGWSAIAGSLGNIQVDLTVCHSSCHISCHGSRGRR